MKRDKIQINKDIVPYKFNILLTNQLFTVSVNYNEKHDFFTVGLELNGETVCEAEPVVYGVPLFKDIYQNGKFPALDIIPLDESGEQNTVTFENFNDTVFLIIDNIGGDDVE